jgi:hypothetical protein
LLKDDDEFRPTYDVRDVFLWEQRKLDRKRLAKASEAADAKVGSAAAAASVREFLTHELNELRINNNLSDRCVSEIVEYCKKLQRVTATSLLDLPAHLLTADSACPAMGLSNFKTKQYAASLTSEVLALGRVHAIV